MYEFENYLDEDLLNEDLLSEDLLESFDEDFDEAKRRGGRRFGRIRPTVRPRVNQQSNFGKSLSGSARDFATKSDLKKALDTISSDVNELKKTSISTNKALSALDGKHTELAKLDARKNDNQTKVLRNMQMMNMMGSLLNQPKLKTENLEIIQIKDKEGQIISEKIQEVNGKKAIEVDQTMSLMLPMMTTMGDSSTGKSDNNMMLPLVLMMSQNKDNSSDNNTMLPLMMMMMMQNQK
ncbi:MULTISPECIES: hypothetical protein [Flavobacterium]|uniref:Uncharacterized protein n=1 Tax=Flavobacterium jumunjinense TaxID=998845 RepID=A0ABV5GI54_9FLAO|nr:MULTISPECIES: hypothetical protein [Flavobacterium]